MKILFYSGYMSEPFNGSNYKTVYSVRGSEIGLVNIAENLVKLGHEVSISFAPILEGEVNGVKYIRVDELQSFINENDLDIIVVNRYVHFFIDFFVRTKKLFVWVQDLTLSPYYCGLMLPNFSFNLLSNCRSNISGLVLLSDWHTDYFKNVYNITTNDYEFFKIGNGIIPEQFSNFSFDRKKRHKFIFNANKPVEKDVNDSLEFFLRYKEKYPEAELHIFKGEISNKVFYDGVFYRGVVPKDEMIEELLSAQFWIYPEYYLETFCTSAFEARAAGCIPVVRISGGLRDSIGSFWYSIDDYDVIDKLQNVSKDEILRSRDEVLKFSWEYRARQWEQLFLG
jgi:glycosyltransferase involved in cell wall biosynthesis